MSSVASVGASVNQQRPRRWMTFLVAAVGFLLCSGLLVPAWAQETAAEAPQETNALVWLLRSMGWFFVPQMAISVAIVSFIAINLWMSRGVVFQTPTFIDEFETMVKNRQFKEAFERAKLEPNILGKVLVAGLQKIPEGFPEAQRNMQETLDVEAMRFEHRLSYLAMLGNVSTMVGLLGTVVGMVSSFYVIQQSGASPDPGKLAEGVSQALVTTVVGLVQAIPAIVFFTIIKNIVAKRFADVEMASTRLALPFKAFAGRRSGEAAAPPA